MDLPLYAHWVIWWHARKGHHVAVNATLSVPDWDPYARGLLVSCDCGRTWAW
jgi:hypothetical protein